ncbi:MAG: hypothetical protein RLZZ282_1453 [Verrucomicrobiota bacterium]
MGMMAKAQRPFAKGELLAAIGNQFGKDARFHTCSAENMRAEDLIEFLIGRGKLAGGDHALRLESGQACQH